jgi:hypothetical protein
LRWPRSAAGERPVWGWAYYLFQEVVVTPYFPFGINELLVVELWSSERTSNWITPLDSGTFAVAKADRKCSIGEGKVGTRADWAIGPGYRKSEYAAKRGIKCLLWSTGYDAM